MKNTILTILCICFYLTSIAQTTEEKVYASLLKTNVSANGKVDYKALKKNETLVDIYLDYLNKTIPGKNWSSDKAKAFWMNVYNAYTIKTVLDNYPLNSLMDIKKEGKNAWEIKSVKVGGYDYTLDYIEHKVLRRWHDDPRIHVGINSASISGPRLPNFLFTEDNVEKKLDYLMKVFLNDGSKNKIMPNDVKLSKIFEWYKEDFSTSGGLIDYLNKYSATKINNTADIKYIEYNWNLNEFKKR